MTPEEIARAKAIPGFLRFTATGQVVISAEQGEIERAERAVFEARQALADQIRAEPRALFEKRAAPLLEMVAAVDRDVHGYHGEVVELIEDIVVSINNVLTEGGWTITDFAKELHGIARRLEEADAAEDAADARLYDERMVELEADDVPELGDAFFREAALNQGAGAVDVGDEDHNRVMAGLDDAKVMIEGGPRNRE